MIRLFCPYEGKHRKPACLSSSPETSTSQYTELTLEAFKSGRFLADTSTIDAAELEAISAAFMLVLGHKHAEKEVIHWPTEKARSAKRPLQNLVSSNHLNSEQPNGGFDIAAEAYIVPRRADGADRGEFIWPEKGFILGGSNECIKVMRLDKPQEALVCFAGLRLLASVQKNDFHKPIIKAARMRYCLDTTVGSVEGMYTTYGSVSGCSSTTDLNGPALTTYPSEINLLLRDITADIAAVPPPV